MSWTTAFALFALAAAVLGFAGGALLARSGPVDRPRDRGSHSQPTPTSGGLAVMAALGIVLTVATLTTSFPAGQARDVALLLLLAGSLGLLGAADDVLDLGASTKLLAQGAVALLFAVFVARVQFLPLVPGLTLNVGPLLGVLGTAAWLVLVVNAINFMDGSNGLAPGVQALALAALAVATPLPSVLLLGAAALGAAASLGFLPWNHPFGRLFQGDAGALFSGFLIAGLSVLLTENGHATPWLGGFILLPLLTDVLLTLLRRGRDRRRLFEAHREHLYQRWLQTTGRSHGALAWRVWLLTAVCAITGLWIERSAPVWAFAGLVGLTGLLAGGWRALSARNPGRF